MNCNSIEWLVDILGTTDLLQAVISDRYNDYPVKMLARGPERAKFKRKSAPFPDGLYFLNGHWYSCRNNVRKDSYTLKYQNPGTAHFCQTFAAMIFLGSDRRLLRAEQYAENVKQAVQFWIDLIGRWREIGDYIVREIQTSGWATNGGVFEGTNDLLRNATIQQLLNFLRDVKLNAATFVPCTEGED